MCLTVAMDMYNNHACVCTKTCMVNTHDHLSLVVHACVEHVMDMYIVKRWFNMCCNTHFPKDGLNKNMCCVTHVSCINMALPIITVNMYIFTDMDAYL